MTLGTVTAYDPLTNQRRYIKEGAAMSSVSVETYRQRPAYTCSVCGDIFDLDDLGHCPSCAHHYPAGSVCGNCHKHTLRQSMKPAGFTVAEWVAKQGL